MGLSFKKRDEIIMKDSIYPALHYHDKGNARVISIPNREDHKFLIERFKYLNESLEMQDIQIAYLSMENKKLEGSMNKIITKNNL